jgi:Mitochondrial carrier protein
MRISGCPHPGLRSAVSSLQGPVNCAATIVREEGLWGLWSGASPTVLRNGTNQMCLFWAKNHMDGVLWSERPPPPHTAFWVFPGCCAACRCCCAPHGNFWCTNHELIAHCLVSWPAMVLTQSGRNDCRLLWRAGKHDGDGKQLAAWQSMVSGGAAAILGPTVTNPFDVVKVRALPADV